MHYIMTTVLGVVCLLSLIGFAQSDVLKLKIEPRYLQFNPDTTTEAKAICTLHDISGRNVPLADCQFVINGNEHIWEFDRGMASPQSSSGRWTGRYQGKGLQHGECGITLTGLRNNDRPILGCRVRASVVNTWIYETMMMYAEPWAPVQFHLQPQVTLATAGSSIVINGVAEHELGTCYFFLPPVNNTVSLDFSYGLSSQKYSLARYHGAGLRQKQCGITLLDVQPERSGFVEGWVIRNSFWRASADFVQLIVLTAPEAPPLLTVNTTGLLAPGDVIHATCVVNNSRPVANLTWILGDVIVRSDNINEAPLDSKWRWSHDLQTIEQHLEHVVTLGDNGKQLECKASHVALASGSQVSSPYVIRLQDPTNPCQPNSCPSVK